MDENDPFGEPNQALTILQGAIENTNEGFVTIDENHRVIIFNREAERIFGVNRKEILGKDLGVILTPQCSQGTKRRWPVIWTPGSPSSSATSRNS